jgi:hypothetical protein
MYHREERFYEGREKCGVGGAIGKQFAAVFGQDSSLVPEKQVFFE